MLLLDTHTLIWMRRQPEKLSPGARTVLEQATELSVSAASLYEIAYKGALGRWPEVEDLLAIDLDHRLRSEGVEVISATGAIMQRAGALNWSHRDPFDRLIVSTAMHRQLPVVSKDETLDTVGWSAWRRIW